jgi:hypothetical protein
MRRVLIVLAGLGLLGASLLPNSMSAAGTHTQIDGYVLVPTPTPTPKVTLVFPNQRAGTPTPQVKVTTP